MTTGSVCVRCVASMDTVDTVLSNREMREKKDRCVIVIISGDIFTLLLFLFICFWVSKQLLKLK